MGHLHAALEEGRLLAEVVVGHLPLPGDEGLGGAGGAEAAEQRSGLGPVGLGDGRQLVIFDQQVPGVLHDHDLVPEVEQHSGPLDAPATQEPSGAWFGLGGQGDCATGGQQADWLLVELPIQQIGRSIVLLAANAADQRCQDPPVVRGGLGRGSARQGVCCPGVLALGEANYQFAAIEDALLADRVNGASEDGPVLGAAESHAFGPGNGHRHGLVELAPVQVPQGGEGEAPLARHLGRLGVHV